MIRRTKPAKKENTDIKRFKPLYVGQIQVYFKKEVSLCFDTYAMYMGSFKAFIISNTDKGWKIQCNLPHLPVFPFEKPISNERDVHQLCIKMAHSFCSLLNDEKTN